MMRSSYSKILPISKLLTLGISETIVAVNLKECDLSLRFSKELNSDPVGKLKVGAYRKTACRALKAF